MLDDVTDIDADLILLVDHVAPGRDRRPVAVLVLFVGDDGIRGEAGE